MNSTGKMQNTWTRLWPEIPLGEVAAISTACLYPMHDWADDDFESVTIIDRMTDSDIVLSEPRFMRISERELQKFRFKKGDLIFNHKTSPGNIGKCVVFDSDLPVLHTKYLRIRPSDEIDSQFLHFILTKYKTEGRMKNMAKMSSNLALITLRDLYNLLIPCPPMEMQKDIVSTTPELSLY